VPGTLPVRSYGWRNDRSEPLKTDTYTETTVTLTVSPENDYSAVKLSDEAKEWDFGGAWGKLFDAQTTAVTRKIELDSLEQIVGAPYEAQIVIDPSSTNLKAAIDEGRDLFFNAFSDAKQIMAKMRCPMDGQVFAVAGANFAGQLRKNQKAGLATSDSTSAFAQNTIGTYAGITVVEDFNIDPDACYVYAKSGIVMFNAAPSIPLGAVRGAIQSKNGISLRWLQDYDHAYQIDRSTFSAWKAFSYVEDSLIQRNTDKTQDIVGSSRYFLRGVKLVLKAGTYASAVGYVPGDGGSATGGREGASATSELGLVFQGKPFTGTLPAGEDFPNVLLTAKNRADAAYAPKV
jgi:hypothetical protein